MQKFLLSPEQKRCRKHILPISYPKIFFVDGVCSFCVDFENQSYQKMLKGKEELRKQLALGKSNKYDCIVPLSGGKDSSFIKLYLVRELGLNLLSYFCELGFPE